MAQVPQPPQSPTKGYTTVAIKAPDVGPRSEWGYRMDNAGDLDGDGVSDLYVSAPSFAGPKSRGRVYAISGKSLTSQGQLKVLRTIDAPPAEKASGQYIFRAYKFGFQLTSLQKAGGKKEPLVAVGYDPSGVKLWVFNGKTGKRRYTINNPGRGAHARFGSRMGVAGDLNHDGTPELIVGAPGNLGPKGCTGGPDGPKPKQKTPTCVQFGQAFVFNGKNGKLIRTLDVPADDRKSISEQGTTPGKLTPGCAKDCGSFGLSVQGVGDIDGDKVADQQVGAGNYSDCSGKTLKCFEREGRIYLFSGKSGKLIRKVESPRPQSGANFGFQDAQAFAPSDLNHDGVPELYGNGFLQDGPAGAGQGVAWVLNGKTGKALLELNDPTPSSGGIFGWSAAKTRFDPDGVSDLLIGSAPHGHGERIDNPDGGLAVFSGKDGQVLATFDLPEQYRAKRTRPSTATDSGFTTFPALGWALAAPGDLNGDGRPDFVSGAPGAEVDGVPGQGVVIAFISAKE